MKLLMQRAQDLLALWTICLIASASCGVFYTKSSDNNYPRIGRRAFYTGGSKGSTYPRIGRSGGGPSLASDDVMFGSNRRFLSAMKRGIFTANGQSEFPRIGRRGEVRGSEGGRLSAAAAVVESVETPGVMDSSAEAEDIQFEVPLGLLFFDFDKNGDKTLSREEFVSGLSRARQDGTACR